MWCFSAIKLKALSVFPRLSSSRFRGIRPTSRIKMHFFEKYHVSFARVLKWDLAYATDHWPRFSGSQSCGNGVPNSENCLPLRAWSWLELCLVEGRLLVCPLMLRNCCGIPNGRGSKSGEREGLVIQWSTESIRASCDSNKPPTYVFPFWFTRLSSWAPLSPMPPFL